MTFSCSEGANFVPLLIYTVDKEFKMIYNVFILIGKIHFSVQRWIS